MAIVNKTDWFMGALGGRVGQASAKIKFIEDGDWRDADDWQDFGRTQSIKFTPNITWADINFQEEGSEPANAQSTGQGGVVELALGEMYAEVFEKIWPGAKILRDEYDEVKSVVVETAYGQRLTKKMFWLKLTAFDSGFESDNPLDTIYALGAARPESGEVNFDLSQQVVTVPIRCFVANKNYIETPVVNPVTGKPLMFWTNFDEYLTP